MEIWLQFSQKCPPRASPGRLQRGWLQGRSHRRLEGPARDKGGQTKLQEEKTTFVGSTLSRVRPLSSQNIFGALTLIPEDSDTFNLSTPAADCSSSDSNLSVWKPPRFSPSQRKRERTISGYVCVGSSRVNGRGTLLRGVAISESMFETVKHDR